MNKDDKSRGTNRVKRSRRKAARPAEILDAGMQLFAEHGFAATRLEDVAKRAGLAKGTIYLYFPSKEALFEAALRDRLLNTIDEIGGVAGAFEGGTEDLLRYLLNTIYDRVLSGDAPVLLKILIAEGHRFPDLVAMYRNIVIARGLVMIRAVFERGAARGELRIEPSAIDPRLVLAPAFMAALWQMIFDQNDPIDRDAYLQGHLEMLLHGVLRP